MGCALAYSPERYKKQIYKFKDELKKYSWINLFEFCKPAPGKRQSTLPPGVIYENDIIKGVGKAHIIIGELSYPSSGLGAELAVAMREHKIRTAMFAKKGRIVSMLWVGAPDHNRHATFTWYKKSIMEHFDDIIEELKMIHLSIQPKKKTRRK